MARAKNGQAISTHRRTEEELEKLNALLADARVANDLEMWRRAQAVSRYLNGKSVVSLCEELGVVRASINRWLKWYNKQGADGLRPRKAAGAAPKLSSEQRAVLASLVEAGPQAAGFTSGMWTGPMIGDLIRKRFGVDYHSHHVCHLLHQMGFSVQRPRKRLAKADADLQATWIRDRLPAIKKKPPSVEA